MIDPTKLSDCGNETEFIKKAINITTAAELELLLDSLPIVNEENYAFDINAPEKDWTNGGFHWIPVGRDRGNAGRIKLASNPLNPICERTINGMEAIIELERQKELLLEPLSGQPQNPREAVMRYFDLPPLDELPKMDDSEKSKKIKSTARKMAEHLRIRLLYSKRSKEFTVSVEDDGIGQPPSKIHSTLLSLGSTTKADKPYLIGVFGQGGSSAFQTSKYSWIASRLAPELIDENNEDGLGWTVIRAIFPANRRDPYYAYLACHPDGRVPFISGNSATEANICHGTRFVHIGYDFGKSGSSISRNFYMSLNHIIFNPVFPFETHVGSIGSPTVAPMYGNGYRLSNLGKKKSSSKSLMDKTFSQTVQF